MLGFRPGQRILDWGSGCGWFLTWAEVYYGLEGYGIDMSGPSVAWAQRFSLGSFCQYGGLDLSWVPDDSFDYVISFWSLYHLLSGSDQCTVIGGLVEKLSEGGRMWLGGNCPDERMLGFPATCFSAVDMGVCLTSLASSSKWQRRGIRVDFEVVHDLELFRSMENRHSQVQGDYLFWGGVYSVFVTRL